MPKTKIKSIILFTAMVLVVSGCSSQLKIKNEELGIKDSGEMGGLVEQVEEVEQQNEQAVAMTGEDILVVASSSSGLVASSTDEIDTNDWVTYRNEEYGFEMLMPANYSESDLGLDPPPEEVYEEWDKATYPRYFGLDSVHYIEIRKLGKIDIEKLYLYNKIESLLFRNNIYGVNYYFFSAVFPESTGIVGYDIFFIGEKNDDSFICLTVRTVGGNSKQYLEKIIENFKKLK